METDIQKIVEQFNKEKKQDKPTRSHALTAYSQKEIAKKKSDKAKFMMAYSPAAQRTLCSDKQLCFFGAFPTLADINKEYGTQTSVAWLIPQLLDLSEFCGCKDKLQGESLEECAWLIAQNYYFFKVSELMLFFNYFKQGRYGRFYGSIDPLVIMSMICKFARERGDAYTEYENEKNMQRLEEQKNNSISHAEYLRLKKEKLLNQQQNVQQ